MNLFAPKADRKSLTWTFPQLYIPSIRQESPLQRLTHVMPLRLAISFVHSPKHSDVSADTSTKDIGTLSATSPNLKASAGLLELNGPLLWVILVIICQHVGLRGMPFPRLHQSFHMPPDLQLLILCRRHAHSNADQTMRTHSTRCNGRTNLWEIELFRQENSTHQSLP